MRKARPNSKPEILSAAVALAQLRGLYGFTRAEVAEAVSMAEASVSFHFGSMDSLRKAIVEIVPSLAEQMKKPTFKLSARVEKQLRKFGYSSH